MTTPIDSQRMEKIVSLCKRRGFIFQSSEIYGGLNGAWDYGPLGVELKRNLKNYWWRIMVHDRDDVVGMDGSILTHPAVLEASGHLGGFSDQFVDCFVTRKRFRVDEIQPQSGIVYRFAGALERDALAKLQTEGINVDLFSQDPIPPLRWATGTERPPGVRLSFSVLATSAISPKRAKTTAMEFYRRRGIVDPVLFGEREARVEKTTRYNPENGSLLTEPRSFNLMFETQTGALNEQLSGRVMPVAPAGATGPPSEPGYSGYSGYSGYVAPHEPVKFDSTLTSSQKQSVDVKDTLEAEGTALAYLRPETAQSIFVQFKNILEVSRKKLPFGVAQIGKAFRNEINPRNFTFRSREFEQMELEYFCRAEQGMELLEYWKEERLKFYENIGIPRSKLHVLTVPDEERAFYSKGTYDIEYDFPFGRQELEGVAYRGHYDLSQHQEASGKSLEYFDEETKQRFIPHVVEPSAGVDRTVLALISEAYSEDQAPDEKGKMETRIVLRFHPRMAPIKCAVFPLLKNKEPLVTKAKEIVDLLRPHMTVFYDERGAIGRRYRRQDEIGTPFGVTVDFETLGERDVALRDTVTLRDRDSMKQERVSIGDLVNFLSSRIR
jgi:glycyl-tRNA synthetase